MLLELRYCFVARLHWWLYDINFEADTKDFYDSYYRMHFYSTNSETVIKENKEKHVIKYSEDNK